MTVKELKEKLAIYPDDMQVGTLVVTGYVFVSKTVEPISCLKIPMGRGMYEPGIGWRDKYQPTEANTPSSDTFTVLILD